MNNDLGIFLDTDSWGRTSAFKYDVIISLLGFVLFCFSLENTKHSHIIQIYPICTLYTFHIHCAHEQRSLDMQA